MARLVADLKSVFCRLVLENRAPVRSLSVKKEDDRFASVKSTSLKEHLMKCVLSSFVPKKVQ